MTYERHGASRWGHAALQELPMGREWLPGRELACSLVGVASQYLAEVPVLEARMRQGRQVHPSPL